MVDFVDLDSSNLASAGYDDKSSELHVKFRNGGQFVYSGVPEETYKMLVTASSPGSFFHKNVKGGGFKYRQVTSPKG